MICFHNPEEQNGYLSNWYRSAFTVDEITFSSMEQYMMFKKAILFPGSEDSGKDFETGDGSEIKVSGRMVQRF